MVEIPGTKLLSQENDFIFRVEILLPGKPGTNVHQKVICLTVHLTEPRNCHPVSLENKKAREKYRANWFLFLPPPQAASYLLFIKGDEVEEGEDVFPLPTRHRHLGITQPHEEDLVQLCSSA